MPQFRVHTRNGQQHTVEAVRAEVSGDEVRFQLRQGGSWTSVAATPLVDVVRVERRVNEYDGRRRFIEDRDVTAAVAALDGAGVLAAGGR